VPGSYKREDVKLQRSVSATETWCERWNIKIIEDKIKVLYFSHRRRPPEAHLRVNGRNIPSVNHVKYLGVIFDTRITWRLNIEMIEAKAFRTFITIYCLFSWKGAAIQRRLERGSRGTVGAVTRQLLMKTLQARKDLADALVICKLWKLAMAV
jgi:hypothetical protein